MKGSQGAGAGAEGGAGGDKAAAAAAAADPKLKAGGRSGEGLLSGSTKFGGTEGRKDGRMEGGRERFESHLSTWTV